MAIDNPTIEFKKIMDCCEQNFKSSELWPAYYKRRYLEFLTFYELLPQKQYVKILELGCGIGYYSAFLSKISAEVIATDLETIDPTTHSPGLQITRDFLSSLEIKNVIVMHASAEDLPFEDNTFDLVFSSHVIEHVPNTDKAILEINRVLKPNGINFCVVPTTTDRIYAFFTFYVYLFKRLFVKLFRSILPTKKAISADNNSSPKSSNSGENPYLKHLPFPPPHGVYPSYLEEVKNWTLGNWRKVITRNNKIKLLAQYGLQSNPLLPILGSMFPKFSISIFSMTRSLENKLGKKAILKHFGISTLIITQKTTDIK